MKTDSNELQRQVTNNNSNEQQQTNIEASN